MINDGKHTALEKVQKITAGVVVRDCRGTAFGLGSLGSPQCPLCVTVETCACRGWDDGGDATVQIGTIPRLQRSACDSLQHSLQTCRLVAGD